MKTKIDIFPFQEKIIRSTKSIIVAICGRSSGKSHIASYWAFKKMVECEGMGIITAPVYSQAEIPIKYLIKILNDYKIQYVFNKTPHFAQSPLPSHGNVLSALINGKLKQVKMASADVEDNLRSGSYSWSLIDEACYVSEEAFMVLSPTLRGQGNDFNYQTLLISSPAGKNWVYSNFIENPSDHIEVIRAKSSENIFQVNDEKLKIWRETMSNRMFLQEIEAEILDSNINSIFYAYSKDLLIPQQPIGNKFIVALDQNVSPGAGTILQKRNDSFHILDEIFIDDGANFESYIREIRKKVPLNSTIDLCGDASGNARNVASIQTFYSSVQKGLQSIGYSVYDKTNRSNPKVYESREEVNRLIERKLLVVDPKCKHLIKDFELASWKAKGIFETDKAKYDPHIAESLVYGIWANRPGSRSMTMNI